MLFVFVGFFTLAERLREQPLSWGNASRATEREDVGPLVPVTACRVLPKMAVARRQRLFPRRRSSGTFSGSRAPAPSEARRCMNRTRIVYGRGDERLPADTA